MAKGTTYADGKVRAQLLRDHVDGTPCDRCWQPMFRTQRLDAAHPHDRPRSRYPQQMATHLEHSTCNKRAGDGTKRHWTPLTTSTSRDW